MSKKNKIIISLVVILVVIISGTVVLDTFLGGEPPEVEKISDSGIKNYNEIKLTAHRGFSAVAPENTIAAFEKAGEYGFYAVECDVHLTKDGIWVINHDETIIMMTNGYKKIAESTYDELCEYVIDSGHFVNKYPTQKIPTLESFLVVCAEYNISPQIEIKGGTTEKLQEILDLLEKYNLKETAMIISFNRDMLTTLRELDEEIELWCLVKEITDEVVSVCIENNYALAFNYKKNEDSVIKDIAKNKELKLCAWTVDNLEDAKALYDCGVRYLTTNCITPQ